MKPVFDTREWTIFRSAWKLAQSKVYETARQKGWWDEDREDGTLIALMHSELSEAIEALRHGNPQSAKVKGHSSVAEELADCVIRIMDFAEARGIDVAGAIAAKYEYNKTRAFKHGGKKFGNYPMRTCDRGKNERNI